MPCVRCVLAVGDATVRAGRRYSTGTGARRRAPGTVAHAVIDLITGPLLEDPYRVGRELRLEVQGVFTARRGTYRVLYRIDEAKREVTVIRNDRRRDVYRR